MQKQVGSLYRADGVVIGANLTTLRSTLKFGKPGPTTHYYVDFNVSNSLAPVLGFNKGEYTYVEKKEDPIDSDKVTSFIDYYESESIVKIDDISIIRVTNDIIGCLILTEKAQTTFTLFILTFLQGIKLLKILST